MDSLFLLCIAVVALTAVGAHSTNGCSNVCPYGRYPNSCACKEIGLDGVIDESGRIGNGFGRNGNGFGGNRNGFGGNRNGFGRNRNGFGGNRNGFGRNRNGFGRNGNGFEGNRNGFGGIDNGFGGIRNGFGGTRNGFGGNRNGFGGMGGKFPGNAGDISCDLVRCGGAYETCTMDFGRPRCVRNPMFPGGQAPGLGVCYLPKVTGRCRAAFRRFYFNSRTQRCQRFIYGGCGGNGNNFKTFQECSRACNGGSGGRRY